MISNFPLENCKNGGLKNAISRISTEYRLQFAWPRGKSKEDDKNNLPRKSLSMGAIKPQANIAPVHKKRTLQQDGSSEMEPLVSAVDSGELMGEEKIQEESFSKEDKLQLSHRSEIKTEYEKKFRPFSQYDSEIRPTKGKRDTSIPQQQTLPDTWFTEVIELRKKAGQYKHRGWGTELVPEHIAELYSKQMGLWEQVSRRSSLSALSLASSTHRPISKEEKEKENNKKSSPTKNWSQGKPSTEKIDKYEEYKKEGAHRSRIDNFVRHHLERTTGVGEEGILHSPTREKLEPVIPRRKESSDPNQSPQKTHYTGRSQSAGSPKRGPVKSHQKTPPHEKRERPTTLQTAPTRTKPNTGSVKAGDTKARGTHKPKEISSSNNVDSEKNKEETDIAVLSEPVVKSPPEPTRVKSPEQILMRSPEPVNWTVPLDTGKTFTVTQNVSQDDKSEGEKTVGDLHCLDDPSFSFDGDNMGDVMDKANTRFHHYWATNPQEPPQSSQEFQMP